MGVSIRLMRRLSSIHAQMTPWKPVSNLELRQQLAYRQSKPLIFSTRKVNCNAADNIVARGVTLV